MKSKLDYPLKKKTGLLITNHHKITESLWLFLELVILNLFSQLIDKLDNSYLPVKRSFTVGKSTADADSFFCEARPLLRLNLISYLTQTEW